MIKYIIHGYKHSVMINADDLLEWVKTRTKKDADGDKIITDEKTSIILDKSYKIIQHKLDDILNQNNKEITNKYITKEVSI